jgi:hypothetical protein
MPTHAANPRESNQEPAHAPLTAALIGGSGKVGSSTGALTGGGTSSGVGAGVGSRGGMASGSGVECARDIAMPQFQR